MSNRPHVPIEIAKEILIESGHRCSVCGASSPLERAHIVPWCKSKQHRAKDMICLCANCHERADLEKWGENILKEYKKNPWVKRNFERNETVFEMKTKIELKINLEFRNFDSKQELWIQHALASFLDITPDKIKIVAKTEGSVNLVIELPDSSSKKLFNAYANNKRALLEYLFPIDLIAINFVVTNSIDTTHGMKDLISAIARSIVDKPDEVEVNVKERASVDKVLELRVAKEDLGKIIGYQGSRAKALETILKQASVNELRKLVIDIKDK